MLQPLAGAITPHLGGLGSATGLVEPRGSTTKPAGPSRRPGVVVEGGSPCETTPRGGVSMFLYLLFEAHPLEHCRLFA